MKLIVKYLFMTLIILQGLFIALWYSNINFFGILSWIGKGDNADYIKLFSPLLVYGGIKILYWLADPISQLFTIILRWVLCVGIFYFLYWLFLK